MTEPVDEERWRAEFRAFVRAHHPDRGGEPDAFVAGMARFAASRPPSVPVAEAVPDPAGDLDPRYDRPVEFTSPYPFPMRVAIALIRTVRKQRADRTIQ